MIQPFTQKVKAGKPLQANRLFSSPCLAALDGGGWFQIPPEKLIVCEPLANDPANRDAKALSIGHLAIVKPKALFIKVAEQMERFDRNVGAVESALE